MNFNIAPYFDDFDKTKQFYKILFRPGVAVQTREVNQLQSILQDQITKFGDHMFKEGSMVIPGQVNYNDKLNYLKVASVNLGSLSLTDLEDTFISNTTDGTGIRAQVLKAIPATSTDPITLVLLYTQSNQNIDGTADVTFAANSTLYLLDDTTKTITVAGGSGISGRTVAAGLQSGVYYLAGHFVNVESSILSVKTYADTVSDINVRIGIQYTEEIITADDDSSLYDNATGSPNAAAPGAHRYKITTEFVQVGLDETPVNFFELLRVEEGVLQSIINASQYNILEETLARRTYDESGNYVVDDFKFDIREDRNNNRGTWSATTYEVNDYVQNSTGTKYFVCVQAGTSSGSEPANFTSATIDESTVITDSGGVKWRYVATPVSNRGLNLTGSSNNIVASFGIGKAYVHGYEVNKLANSNITIPKARDTVTLNNRSIPVNVGNYAWVDRRFTYGIPDVASGPVVQFFDRFVNKVSATQKHGLGNVVGTGRIGWTEPDSRGYVKVGLHDVVMNPGKTFLADVKSLVVPDTTTSVASTSYTATSSIKYAGNNTSSYLQISGVIATSSQGAALMTVTGAQTAFRTELIVGDLLTLGTSSHGATCSWTVVAIGSDSSMTLSGPPLPAILSPSNGGTGSSTFIRLAAQGVLGQGSSSVGIGTRFQSEYRPGDTIWLGSATGSSTLTSMTVLSIQSENRMFVSSAAGIMLANTSHGLYYTSRVGNFAADVATNYQIGINARKLTGLYQLYDYSGTTTLVPSGQALRITGTNDAKLLSELATNDYVDINGNKLLITKISSNTVAYAIALEANITGSATQYPAFKVPNSLNDTDYNTLLFPVAPSTVSSIVDNVFTVYKTQTVTGISGLSSLTVTLASASGNDAAEALASSDVNAFYVAQNTTSALSAPVTPTAISVVGNNVTLTFAGNFSSNTARVIYPVTRAAANNTVLGRLRTKTLTFSATDEFLATSVATATTLTLTRADVLRKVKIYMATSFVGTWDSTVQANATDVTSRYDLDNGQRACYYDVGRMNLKAGFPKATGSIKVFYDYFEHGTGDYFAKASYSPNVIKPEDIPKYNNTYLADVLDFRSKVDPTTGLISSSALPRQNTNFISDVSYYLGRKEKILLNRSGVFYNVPGISSLTPELPRISDDDDSIELYDLDLLPYTRSANFPDVKNKKYDNRRYTMKDIGGIEKRVSSLEETTALSLLESKTQSLQIRDNRDSTLERYKTGFFVDNFADNSNADFDADVRFSIDDVNRTLNPSVTYDSLPLVEKINYTPGLTTSSEGIAANANRLAENYAITGELLTLSYTTSTMLSQELATTSIAVAPFVVATFLGSLRVTPDKDIYTETEIKTAIVEVVNNATAENLARQVAELRRTWSRPYAVSEVTTNTLLSTDKVSYVIPFVRPNTVLLKGVGLKPKHKFYAFMDDLPLNDFITGAMKFTFDSMPILNFSGHAANAKNEYPRWRSLYESVDKTEVTRVKKLISSYRQYTSTYDYGWATAELNPKNADAALPNASWRDSYRLALGQGASVYYYESGRVVGSGVAVYQEGTTLYIVNGRGKLAADFLRNAGSYNYTGVWYVSVDGNDPKYLPTTTVTAANCLTSDASGNLYTNENGVAIALFDVPNTQTRKFTSGRKPVVFTDDIDNHPDNWTSRAEGSYTVEGTHITFTNNYRSTKNYVLRPYDPIAQSFKLPSQFTNGAFITDIDIFFQAKPVTELAPVSLELRTCDNTGRPSGTEMVPGTEVTLMPDQVNVDATKGQLPTKFTFRQPVYLMPDKHYAFVVRTDTKNYRVWMATMGQADVNDPSKSYTTQATFGSLFKSQDGTLWTEDQNSDLKFRINRAVFSTVGTGGRAHVVNTNTKSSDLPNDPFTFEHGSNKIRIHQLNHGFSSGDTTRLYSQSWAAAVAANPTTAINGIPVGEIFGSFVSSDTTLGIGANTYLDDISYPSLPITDVTLDSYTVQVSTPANISGGTTGVTYVTGGGSDIKSLRNMLFHAAKPSASILTFEPTELTMDARITQGFTYDNDANSLSTYGKFTKDLKINSYNIMDTSCIILTDIVENNTSRALPGNIDAGVPGTPGVEWRDSFVGVFNMSTTTDHVSPAIDLSTLTLDVVQHRIDNPARANRLPAVIPSIGDTSTLLLVTNIANSSTVVSFDGRNNIIRTEVEGGFKEVVAGRFISISGSTTAGNNYTSTLVKVLNVASDNKSMTVSASLTSAAPGPGITIYQYDDYTEETTTTDASGESKFITKVINLKNPAAQIKMLIEACVPSVADFDIYYKTGSAGADFSKITWNRFIAPLQSNETSSYASIVKSDIRDNFTDVEFNISSFDAVGNPVDLPAFTAFQLKLVMRSSNAARVPQFRNLRVVAHA